MPEPTFRPAELPLRVRAFNAVSTLLPRGRGSFDRQKLLAETRRREKLDDFGSDEFLEPLDVLLDSLAHEHALSPFGRASMRRYLMNALAKRLAIEDCLRQHPEILAQSVTRPLFIVGMPRTGSTHLHHLLAADPLARAPAFWELAWPTPPPAKSELGDPRIERARRAIEKGLGTIPELSVLHIHDAEAPEECHFLLEAALMNPLIPAGERYQRWWRAADLRPAYRYYAKQLKLLSFRSPGQHWVLKAPFHLWHLDALCAVFPDACFVFAHRDPREVVPSAASYAAVRSRTFYSRFDPEAHGRSVLESLSSLIETGLRHRAALPAERFYDVSYRELLGDPLAVVREAHTRFGYPFTEATRLAVERQIARSPQHKHGVHHYSAEQFGLDDASIQRSFAGYLASFGEYL